MILQEDLFDADGAVEVFLGVHGFGNAVGVEHVCVVREDVEREFFDVCVEDVFFIETYAYAFGVNVFDSIIPKSNKRSVTCSGNLHFILIKVE